MIETVKLIGAWTLVKHGRFDQLGNYHPTGEKMNGQLNYGHDGSMSVLITKIPEPLQLNDLIVYAGSFTVDGNKVLHHIKVTPDPKRLNTIETRSASFHGDELVLTADAGENGRYEIVWSKSALPFLSLRRVNADEWLAELANFQRFGQSRYS